MTLDEVRFRHLPASALASSAELAASWDQLNRRRLDLPFLSSAAVAAAHQVFGDGAELLVVGEIAGCIHCMFIVQRHSLFKWRTFRPSQLPLSAWVADPIWRLDDLTRAIQQRVLPMCGVLSVTEIDPLAAPRQDDGPLTTHLDYIPTAWLELHGAFEDYWAARGKNLRQNMKKQRNKLAADGIQATLRVLDSPTQMSAAIVRYGHLEGSGWKSASGTAVHADNAQGRFYTQLFERLSAAGEALVFEYLFDDRTVAMDLCLRRRSLLVVLKTAYDESIGNSLSPAALMREDQLRFLYERGETRRIEYYGRVMDWHTKLTGNSRVLYHLTSYRWEWVRALAQRRRAAEVASQQRTASAANKGSSP